MPSLGLSTTKAGGIVSSYERDGLKLYMPYNSPKEVKFVGQGSTEFDGTGDYVDCNDPIISGTGDYTFIAWIKKGTDTSSVRNIAGNYNTPNAQGIQFGISAAEKFQTYTDGTNDYVTGATDIPLNVWTHVAATRSSNNAVVYVNGVSDATGTLDNDIGDSSDFTIGADPGGPEIYTGSIKNVAVWNRALSATEIQNVMYKTYEDLSGTLSSGLVSWWALESDYLDSTRSDNDGTANGNPVQTASLYGGATPLIPRGVDNAPLASVTSDAPNFGTVKSGRALAFDGAVDYFTIPEVTYDIDGGNVSFVFWAKRSALSDEVIILGDNADRYHHRIYFSATDDTLRIEGDLNADEATLAIPFKDTEWHHYAIVCSSATATGYQDGKSVSVSMAGGSDSAVFEDNITFNSIGASEDNYHFHGYLSNIQIYTAALTQSDVEFLYTHPEMLAHQRSGTSITSSDLDRWYPMTEGNPESPQTTIFDGSPKGLGSELLTNTDLTSVGSGAISAGTTLNGWTHSSSYIYDSVTASSSGVRIVSDGVANSSGYQSYHSNEISVTSGKVYRVEYSVIVHSGSATIKAMTGSVGSSVGFSSSLTTGDNQVRFFTATTTDSTSVLEFYNSHTTASDITVKYVSIKEVQRGNHATSVFLGDELITVTADRDMTSDTGFWNDDGHGTYDATNDEWDVSVSSGGTDGDIIKNDSVTGLVSGKTYRVVYEVKNYVSGNVMVGLGSEYGTLRSANGTYTEDIVSSGANMRFRTSGASGADQTYSIDNVSLKEVGLSTTGHVEGQETIFQPAFVGQNRMIAFDGVDDTLTVSEFTFVPSQSINMWINIDNLDTYRSLFGLAASDNYMRFGADAGNADNEFYFEDDDQDAYEIEVGANTIKPNEWIMLTFVWNADRTMDAYMNSSLRGSSSATIDPSVSGNVENSRMRITKFGGGYSNTWFNGIMTEISYYSDVLTLAEIQDLYNDGQAKSALEASGSGGLVHYWRNNVLTATGTWEDLKGSNDGTLTGGSTVIFPEGTTFGRDINGFFLTHPNKNWLSLDKSDDSGIVIPYSEALDFGTGDFTLECWAKCTNWDRDDSGNDTYLISSYKNDDNRWYLDTNDAKYLQFYSVVGGTPAISSLDSTALTNNTWYHIVYSVVRSGNATMYLNGDLADIEDESDFKSVNYNFVAPVQIGYYISGKTFDGFIDDVRIYKRALSASEVKKNYRHGSGKHKD